MRLPILLQPKFHLLGGAEGSKDGASDPNAVFPLRRSDDLDLHAAGSEGSYFLAHAISNPREHPGTPTEHDVTVQIFPDVHVTLHDGVVRSLMNTSSIHSDHGWLEEDLRASESLCPYGDHLPIGKLVALLHS